MLKNLSNRLASFAPFFFSRRSFLSIEWESSGPDELNERDATLGFTVVSGTLEMAVLDIGVECIVSLSMLNSG